MNNLSLVLAFVLSFFKLYNELTVGGRKIGYYDVFRLGPVLGALPGALNGLKAAAGEWENAGDDERKKLIADFKAQFNLDDKSLEARIEAGVSLLVKLGAAKEDVVVLIKGLAKPAAVAALAAAEVAEQGAAAPQQA